MLQSCFVVDLFLVLLAIVAIAVVIVTVGGSAGTVAAALLLPKWQGHLLNQTLFNRLSSLEFTESSQKAIF